MNGRFKQEVRALDENEALRRLKQSDEDALAWFIERYAPYAAAIIGRIMLPALAPSDAEEALADVFVRLWRNAGRVPPDGVRAYIAAIARNRALDALRAKRDALPLEDAVIELDAPTPEQALTESEARERTRAAVEGMPEPDREIFLRRYYYCQSVAEIALALDMNTNTVKTRLSRGRERLRRELASEAEHEV